MRGARETIALRLKVAVVGLLAALLAAVLAGNGSAAAPQSGLQRAIAAQEQHTGGLLARGGIVGTGVSRDAGGAAEIVVLATHPVQVPETLSGVDVELKVTGPISALKLKASKKPGGGGSTELTPTSRFPRPVPIGVSTGNAGECSAGTIGARVTDASGNVYALSNNHVYARENKAAIGSQVLQPGRYDTGCSFSVADAIGSLSAFEPIVFSTAASNTIDAAIAAVGAGQLGTATPANGYGEPSSTPVAASAGLPVQKYGRTTSLTSGVVTATNGIVNVSYSAGTARFVNQVFVESTKPILKSGDSGSLLVTRNAGANPVGLLFASGSSGKFAIANPIGAVLARFGVEVDGK